MNNPPSTSIGYIVGGSLKDNLRARLTVPSQEVMEGSFVTIQSGPWKYYGLVTDLQLGSTDPRFADEQSETRLPPGLAGLLHGQTLYTNIEILPSLMYEIGPEPGSPEYRAWRAAHREDPVPMTVKTVPPHHAEVRPALAEDVAAIFGRPETEGNFIIGYTREQGHPVCINLDTFVQRSAGVFGATGTGKSFLTRILLAGLIHRDRASVLVFDMHNEYGFDDIASDTRTPVIGLHTKFPSKVRVVGLGKGALIHGRHAPDFDLVIGEKDITPADIELLWRELNLKETTPTTLDALQRDFGAHWFHEFKNMENGTMIETEEGKKVPAPGSVAAWANSAGIHVSSAEALHSKLGRLFSKPYIVEDAPSDSLQNILQALEAGKHIILSFGEYENDLDYLFVTNLITRRVRDRWVDRTNEFRSHHDRKEPRPLVIVVEEAHKLLNREMASQTTFSTIAREMRKYFVTLLVIDQRPSQIYDEVLSQLGTRISGALSDESDIQAVLSGVAGKDALRGMLAHLQQKQEVLLLGWGVPMPIPVRSRRYDDQFWQELLGGGGLASASENDLIHKLGFGR